MDDLIVAINGLSKVMRERSRSREKKLPPGIDLNNTLPPGRRNSKIIHRECGKNDSNKGILTTTEIDLIEKVKNS